MAVGCGDQEVERGKGVGVSSCMGSSPTDLDLQSHKSDTAQASTLFK